MRTLLVTVLLLSVCLFTWPAAAQDAAPSDTAGPTPDWIDDASAELPPAPEPGSNEDLLAEFNEVRAAYAALKDAEGGKMVAWFLLIAAVCNLLISAIKRLMKLTSRGKKYLPWVALGLGVIAGFFSYYALGIGLLAALWYGAGPPFSVLIQELVRPIPSKE